MLTIYCFKKQSVEFQFTMFKTAIVLVTRKLSYRKDDRAMRPM